MSSAGSETHSKPVLVSSAMPACHLVETAGEALSSRTIASRYMWWILLLGRFPSGWIRIVVSCTPRDNDLMPFSANVLRVMIASPGDVAMERAIATEEILGWNDVNASTFRCSQLHHVCSRFSWSLTPQVAHRIRSNPTIPKRF